MKNQFSLAHLTVLECSPAEMTYIAAKAGYDFVSFRPIGLGTVNEPQYPLAENKKMFHETKKALNETGLQLLDIEMVRIYDEVNLEDYLPAFEVAAELGGKHVLTTIQTDDREFATEKFAEICELAKPFGLTIDLEFITWYNISTLKDAGDIVRRANCDNGGILIDLLHFDRSNVKLEELDSLPEEWFHYAHVCDAPKEVSGTTEGLIYTAREDRLYPGEGGIDMKPILNRLPKIPYSLEIPNAKRAQEYGYEKFARYCLENAKSHLSTVKN
ncbi:sugar phosphate isomerase/epimerase family protein [Oceanobacillus jeddahense]|uniref:sugar phosphate isomerase/epimerase family protein n=1 Tax=Oceanobacillus jeddahense TaxID=1462527 RepID=UPI0005961EBD|nr:TIM barrel protein [Oceanobacillus jeddahense]